MRRPGRLHAPELAALVATVDGLVELRAPQPGLFVPAIAAGELVAPGSVIGDLVVLGRASAVVAPAAASGIVVRVATASHAASYGQALVALDPALQRGATAAAAETAPAGVDGLVFRAPTSGRFYGRSAPDKPPFVVEGTELAPGATICLLEVMKTFHRVTYGGAGLPERARVRALLVRDGDDVNAGDPLLALGVSYRTSPIGRSGKQRWLRRPDDLVRENLSALLRALDAVFGATLMALSLFATWLYAVGSAQLTTVIAIWMLPAFNLPWTRWAPREGKWLWLAHFVRGMVSLPIVTVIYIADTGMLQRMWLPGLLLAVGIGLALGITTRRIRLGVSVAGAYALAIVLAATWRTDTFDFESVRDATGVLVVSVVISMVASRLGRSLDDAQRQRHQVELRTHELSRALDELHAEVAQRARVEIELRQAQKLESVGRLAAGVAHEINTPVQFVNDSVQFVREAMSDVFALIDKLGTAQRSIVDGAPSRAAALAANAAVDEADLPYLTEHVPKALGNAIDGLGRVAAIVRALKTFAHPDGAGKVAADLNQAIQSTLTMARNEYRYIAELDTDLGDLPPVWCHVGELNQAVLNIVINAAHAIGDVVAGTDHKGRIRVRTHREGDDVVIAIADTGAGIPDTVRAHIFDPFFTTKPVGRGSGQGLSIARSVIVDKHGGQLALETEPGKGTTFFIRLPIHERAAVVVS